MTSYVYVVKDELSAQFSLFGVYVNKAVAERDFQRIINNDGIPVTDLMLYECGTLNSSTGTIDAYSTPIFIVRGEKKDNEV